MVRAMEGQKMSCSSGRWCFLWRDLFVAGVARTEHPAWAQGTKGTPYHVGASGPGSLPQKASRESYLKEPVALSHTAKPSKCRATCQSRRELPASQLWPLPLPSWILAQTPLAARPVLRPQPRTRPWPHAWILTAFPRHLAAPRLGSVRLPSPGSPPATPRGSTS